MTFARVKLVFEKRVESRDQREGERKRVKIDVTLFFFRFSFPSPLFLLSFFRFLEGTDENGDSVLVSLLKRDLFFLLCVPQWEEKNKEHLLILLLYKDS